MQAGGRRFEPDRLHQHVPGRLCSGAVGFVHHGEVLRFRVRRGSADGGRMDPEITDGMPAGGPFAAIFVRVNQVLVRLWACPVAMSDRLVGYGRAIGRVWLPATGVGSEA